MTLAQKDSSLFNCVILNYQNFGAHHLADRNHRPFHLNIFPCCRWDTVDFYMCVRE